MLECRTPINLQDKPSDRIRLAVRPKRGMKLPSKSNETKGMMWQNILAGECFIDCHRWRAFINHNQETNWRLFV